MRKVVTDCTKLVVQVGVDCAAAVWESGMCGLGSCNRFGLEIQQQSLVGLCSMPMCTKRVLHVPTQLQAASDSFRQLGVVSSVLLRLCVYSVCTGDCQSGGAHPPCPVASVGCQPMAQSQRQPQKLHVGL
jgi:hypothetical protein